MSSTRWERDGASETNRDHARDEFLDGLRELGVEAELMPRGVPEERVLPDQSGRAEGRDSLGAIAVKSGPVRWVDIRKQTYLGGDFDAIDYHFAAFGVPDARLAGSRLDLLGIWSAKRRSFPLVGKVTAVYWKGNDLGSGILISLNENCSLNEKLLDSEPIRIRAHSAPGCWTLTVCVRIVKGWRRRLSPEKLIPSRVSWQVYEAIASQLLTANVT